MNKIKFLILGVFFFANTNEILCQTITDSEWFACNIYSDSTFLNFENYTLFLLRPNAAVDKYSISTYVIEEDTLSINDLEFSIAETCNPLITGKYEILIEQDTLSFNEISDGCNFRLNVLSQIKLKRESTTSLANDVDFNRIKIYPNPVLDKLTIEGNSNFFYNYEIYNQLGNKVRIGIINGRKNIHLESLSSGIYIVRIIKKNKYPTMIYKIIKL